MERRLIETYMLTGNASVQKAIGNSLEGYPMKTKRRQDDKKTSCT